MNRSRRSVLTAVTASAAVVATSCSLKPKAVDLVATYPKVSDAMKELFRAVGGLQAFVAVLDTDTWRAMVPDIKSQTLRVSEAASKMGMTLRFPV